MEREAARKVGGGWTHVIGAPTQEAVVPSAEVVHTAVELPSAVKPGVHPKVQVSPGADTAHVTHGAVTEKLCAREGEGAMNRETNTYKGLQQSNKPCD